MSLFSYFGIAGADSAEKVNDSLDEHAVTISIREKQDYPTKILACLNDVPAPITHLIVGSGVRYDTAKKYVRELAERGYAKAVYQTDSPASKPKYIITDKGRAQLAAKAKEKELENER